MGRHVHIGVKPASHPALSVPNARVLPVECSIGNTVAFSQIIYIFPEECWGIPRGMLAYSQRNAGVFPEECWCIPRGMLAYSQRNAGVFPEECWRIPREMLRIPSGTFLCSQRNVPAIPTFETLPFWYLQHFKFNQLSMTINIHTDI